MPGTGQYDELLVLGPAEIWFGTAGSERQLGAMVGGMTLNGEFMTADIKKDPYGDGPYDQVFVGTNVNIEGNLADLRFDALADTIPGTTLTDDGDATPTQSKLQFASPVGTNLRSIAKQLIIKPTVGGVATADQNKWYTFAIAAAIPTIRLAFSVTEQSVMPIRFQVFPDTTTTQVLGYKGYASPA